MAIEQRVQSYFRVLKNAYYVKHAGVSDPVAFNDEVWLPIAGMFSIPVRQVKDIVKKDSDGEA